MWWMPSIGRTVTLLGGWGKLARASIARVLAHASTGAQAPQPGTRPAPATDPGGSGSLSELSGRLDGEDRRVTAREQGVRHAAPEQAAQAAVGARPGDDEVVPAVVGQRGEHLARGAGQEPRGHRGGGRYLVARRGQLLLHLALEVAQQRFARERHRGRPDRGP